MDDHQSSSDDDNHSVFGPESEVGNNNVTNVDAQDHAQNEVSNQSNAGESIPPVAQGQHTSANALKHTHPLWQRAAGHAPPADTTRRARSNGEHGAPRFEPLSAFALEMNGFRHNADGDSALFSDSESSDGKRSRRGESNRGRKKAANTQKNKVPRIDRNKQKRSGDDGDDDDEDNEDNEDDEDDEDDEDECKASGARTGNTRFDETTFNPLFASAAFGTTHNPKPGGTLVQSPSMGTMSDASATSSKAMRRAHRAAFPVKGVLCPGCTLVKHIQPVENFIYTNMEKMSEDALWKFAALTYVREVQVPCNRENVLVPNWGWKDLRTHYLLHNCSSRIARMATCRQLQTMRYAVDQRLMRINDGEREVDKTGCELMLKIIKAESEQRTSLAHMANASTNTNSSKKFVSHSTVGDPRV
jgi:hypothetical protein